MHVVKSILVSFNLLTHQWKAGLVAELYERQVVKQFDARIIRNLSQ